MYYYEHVCTFGYTFYLSPRLNVERDDAIWMKIYVYLARGHQSVNVGTTPIYMHRAAHIFSAVRLGTILSMCFTVNLWNNI